MTWKEPGWLRQMVSSIKNILNLPNFLTLLRLIILPIFIYFLFQKEFIYQFWAFILFLVASITDLVDGYIARKLNQETEFGKFLDPLADKFLVIGTFITFLFLHQQIELWMVLVIVFRDMLITFLRWLAVREGKPLRTTVMAKVKTAFQMGTIIFILIIFLLISGNRKNIINELYMIRIEEGYSTFEIATMNFLEFMEGWREGEKWTFQQILNRIASFLPYFGMLLTTIITFLSGVRYLVANYKLLKPSNIILAFRGKHASN